MYACTNSMYEEHAHTVIHTYTHTCTHTRTHNKLRPCLWWRHNSFSVRWRQAVGEHQGEEEEEEEEEEEGGLVFSATCPFLILDKATDSTASVHFLCRPPL